MVLSLVAAFLLFCSIPSRTVVAQCDSLCADGSEVFADNTVTVPGGGTFSCGELGSTAGEIGDSCSSLQVLTWASCGCPTLPAEFRCPICPEGSSVVDPSIAVNDELTCGLAQAGASIGDESVCESMKMMAADTCCSAGDAPSPADSIAPTADMSDMLSGAPTSEATTVMETQMPTVNMATLAPTTTPGTSAPTVAPTGLRTSSPTNSSDTSAAGATATSESSDSGLSGGVIGAISAAIGAVVVVGIFLMTREGEESD